MSDKAKTFHFVHLGSGLQYCYAPGNYSSRIEIALNAPLDGFYALGCKTQHAQAQ